jgi:tetratricopeptide (TPR) repeat protein
MSVCANSGTKAVFMGQVALAILLVAATSVASQVGEKAPFVAAIQASWQSPGTSQAAAVPSASSHIDALMRQGLEDFRRGDYEGALPFFRQVVDSDPRNVVAYNLARNCSRELKDYLSAIDFFKHALEIQPDKYHNVAGLIQVYTLAGMARQRDELRLHIGVLENDNKLPPNCSYVFETFEVGDERVQVSEFPQITGYYGDRYHFDVFDSNGKQIFRVALESDALEQAEWAKQHSTEATAGGRFFSLDGYAGDKHSTLSSYDVEPPFEQFREEVKRILAGEMAPIRESTTTLYQLTTNFAAERSGTFTAQNPADAEVRPETSQRESRYTPADPDLFGMNITVLKKVLGDQYHLQVDFTVPAAREPITRFTLITIYGLRREGEKRLDLPPDTFPSVRGNWKPGDRVTLQINLPKKFADPARGWDLTFCVGGTAGCFPSPNLLTPIGTRSSIAESLNRIKAVLESYSNVQASRVSENPLQVSDSYRITDINNCLITLVHTRVSIDRNYDGGKTTSTALINLSSLRSDVKVSEKSYGKGWKPPSRWLVVDNVADGRTPIRTENVIESFPGPPKRIDQSESNQLEIEFLDYNVAEVVGKELVNLIVACGMDK